MNLAVVILAAGQGTRMKSKIPKVNHPVAGKPMVCHVYDEAARLKPAGLTVVISPGSDAVKECLRDNVNYAIQKEQLGTAHALQTAEPFLKGFKGNVLVLYGDTPLIEADTLGELIDFHEKTEAVATIATAILEDPTGYGRIIRSNQQIAKIVEEKDTDPEQKKIKEINSGMYCFKAEVLFEKLKQVQPHNKQVEYYLTDVVSMLVARDALVETFEVPADEILGVNSRQELAQANLLIYQRTIAKWMDNSVTVVDPLNTYIEKDVQIGQDTVIQPQTMLKSNTVIGKNCNIGPGSIIKDSKIGNGSQVFLSVIDRATVGADCNIGPYSHLRPDTVLKDRVKVGSFSEVKNSRIAAGSRVPHLSYIGDTDIEEQVNVGAGTITCNYDGDRKHKTIIKKGAFIGSDTMLVAPVTVGENAFTGAGSVITKDVPNDALAIERSEQKNIKDYSKKK